MSPAELLNADDHLAACETCRQQLIAAAQLQEVFSSLRADLESAAETRSGHLSDQQFAACINDEADDVNREIAESHLAICPRCAAEVYDLVERRTSTTINSFSHRLA